MSDCQQCSDLRMALRSTISSLRSVDSGLADHLEDKFSSLLLKPDTLRPVNVEMKCRDGHTYVTDANDPGKCWCGSPAEITLV